MSVLPSFVFSSGIICLYSPMDIVFLKKKKKQISCFCNSFIVENYSSDQRRQWHSTPILLPGKSHERRSMVGCSPWGRKESDTTEWIHFHFSLSCIGEGNGNPLRYSCLENHRDRGAWWAPVYGVAQSWTRLKWLSISSSIVQIFSWFISFIQWINHSAYSYYILIYIWVITSFLFIKSAKLKNFVHGF